MGRLPLKICDLESAEDRRWTCVLGLHFPWLPFSDEALLCKDLGCECDRFPSGIIGERRSESGGCQLCAYHLAPNHADFRQLDQPPDPELGTLRPWLRDPHRSGVALFLPRAGAPGCDRLENLAKSIKKSLAQRESVLKMMDQLGTHDARMILMSLTILEMEIGLSATHGHAMLPENSDGDRVLSQLSAVSDPRFSSWVSAGPWDALGISRT
eukprot:Skav208751  [mRNA]  locus=scaffold1871:70431:76889:+ [translate_table: standard]